VNNAALCRILIHPQAEKERRMELALIFQIISTTAVLLGILFGLLNLRNFQMMRKREAAILMLNSFQTNEFVRGLLVVFDLPGNVTKAKIDKLPKEDYLALYIVLGTWERLGILVHRREISLDLVDDAFSGTILVSWNKLGNFINQFRESSGRATGFEWFQWLAERIMEREHGPSATPAYIRHKKWKA
jgi:Domain of unknown function (DUF4760)